MDRLSAVVERITYQNEANGFCVLRVRAKGYADLLTAVGKLAGISPGAGLELSGEWKTDGKYGRQFSVSSYRETLPATLGGIEKYLGSGMVKGVGPAMARAIVKRFGQDTLNVIEDKPERLHEVPGIGKKRVSMIVEAWREHKEIRNVMIFLQSNGVSAAYAVKIYKTYGDDSVRIVKENPFRLADDIWGVGFVTADRIAQNLGFAKDSSERLRAGVLYALNKFAEEGHCFARQGELIKRAAALLEAGEGDIEACVERLVAEKRVVRETVDSSFGGGADAFAARADALGASVASDEPAVYLPPFYFCEKGVAKRVAEIIKSGGGTQMSFATRPSSASRSFLTPSPVSQPSTLAPSISQSPVSQSPVSQSPVSQSPVSQSPVSPPSISSQQRIYASIEEAIRWTEAESRVRYDDVQRSAVTAALTCKLTVLTGGPGTGKTTTTNAIIKAYEKLGAVVLLAAPTGRAAKRMTETTGREAKTVHRLLEYKPPDGYARDAENPLDCNVLVVDEASMLDVALANSLLKAVSPGTAVIFVGDADQLPSVGPGNVLKDLIRSGAARTVELKRIFRQAQSSDIVKNAHLVNAGRMPVIKGGAGTDFFFVEREDPAEVAREIVGLCKERLPAYYNVDPFEDIQALCPMTRGEAGTANLNAALSDALNPCDSFVRYGAVSYKLGDKVMQIRNNYDKNVFNGDIGRIVGVNGESFGAMIRFDGRDVPYETSELDEIALAYAVTVHKSQGSEYPIVVCPVTTQHYMMLQKNLLYTAITRAKRVLVMVGTRKALSIAVRNRKSAQRNSALAARIADAVAQTQEQTGK